LSYRDDITRCQLIVDKYIEFAKRYSSRGQYKHALEILLPTGILYEYLEGRIPNPAYTYIKIADISELEERDRTNTEIGHRRTRLGAKIGQVTADVKREVFESSDLENLYSCIINWTDDDETRRRYEEKILQHSYDALALLEPSKKTEKRERIQSLAQGLVILKHPFALAWKIVLEWSDVEEVGNLDGGLLKEYMEYFPQEGLSKVIHGYLESDISPFPKPSITLDESETDQFVLLTPEDRLILMTEGIADCSSSIIARRLMGEYYSHLDEYESAATVAREAQNQIVAESHLSGLSFSNSVNAISIILGTALVQYQAPRHHPEARLLFNAVLHRKPTQASALIGVGLILEEEEDYGQAITFLERALKRNPDPRIKAECAWCKFLNGDREIASFELEKCLPEMQGSDIKTRTLRAQTIYRIGVCIWDLDKSRGARKARDGAYSKFLAALQADMNFAPAYTSLGIFYADYAKDKKRARKCFQKAVELSASEVEAAERLADSFANSEEWDLVEMVAQRVIESGKVKPAPGSKRKGVSWPFTALGVVQLNRQDYANGVVSFQSALRTSPQNHHTWIGLGEAYHNSGRYIAATRAFEQAQILLDNAKCQHAEDSWFCKYMLANVRRELGEFEIAVEEYREVLSSRPSEMGVSIALLQTLVESAWRSIDCGFFRRSVNLAKEAINLAMKIIEQHDSFSSWKAVGDACSIFSCIQAYAADFPLEEVRVIFGTHPLLDAPDILINLDKIDIHVLQAQSDNDSGPLLEFAIYAAILGHKRSIQASSNDIHARAVAWYNLGWAEFRAHVCGSEGSLALQGGTMSYLRASIQCFKRAIELEAGNSDFWDSLGVVTVELNPKVAQHSFIRSLHLNERNPRVWTNLGTFYLMRNDHELANQAFARAQSADPDYAHAWIGQAILALQFGDFGEYRGLCAHAFTISASSSTIVKQQYAVSAFDQLLSLSSSKGIVDILEPQLALKQLQRQRPSDLAFQHLAAMFAERTGDFNSAKESLQALCSALELDYEASEDPVALSRFSETKADLSRAQLALQDFISAAEDAETARDLSADEEPASPRPRKLRLSASLTAGLAYYHQGLTDSALSMFRNALEEGQDDPDIICLLVQVLWAKGGDEARSIARDQLFNCVKKFPGHFGAATLLGAVAVLADGLDTIQAILPELQDLRTRESLTIGQEVQLAQLLNAIESLHSKNPTASDWVGRELTTAVMLSPSRPHTWTRLAESCQEPYPSEMAKLMTLNCVRDGLADAEDLFRAYSGTERVDDVQRARMIAPWMGRGREEF
jgi:superkiller protein 3